MAEVEQHAALTRLPNVRLHFAGETVDYFQLAVVEDVRVHVTGTELIEQLLAAGAAGVGEDLVIHHHRHIRKLPRLHGATDGDPSGATEVSGLDSYDHVAILRNLLRGRLRIHIGGIAFVSRNHAVANN